MRGLLFSFCFIMMGFFSYGQNEINQVDGQGNKQGYWVKKYPNGNKLYEGTFKGNKPIGEMKRYFEDGSIKAVMFYYETGDSINATRYYQNGIVASEGLYINTQKHGSWSYYSFFDTSLVKTENFYLGKKEGVEENYYPNGSLAEIINWKNDLKHGEWGQFYDDKTPKTKGSFIDGEINGSYYVYYSNGRPEVIGLYKSGKMDGIWQYYNSDGEKTRELKFKDGKPENIDQLTEEEQEFFEKIEKNMGKIQDPTIEEVYR